MAKVKYKKQSPYYTTNQTSWYLSNLNYRDIPADVSDTKIIITGKYQNRPDLLSYELYGTTDYWWIFMIRNPNVIKDPIYDFLAGREIFAPTASRLVSILGS